MKSASIILEALGAFMLRDLQLVVPTGTDVVDIASGDISTGTERLLCIPDAAERAAGVAGPAGEAVVTRTRIDEAMNEANA